MFEGDELMIVVCFADVKVATSEKDKVQEAKLSKSVTDQPTLKENFIKPRVGKP